MFSLKARPRLTAPLHSCSSVLRQWIKLHHSSMYSSERILGCSEDFELMVDENCVLAELVARTGGSRTLAGIHLSLSDIYWML